MKLKNIILAPFPRPKWTRKNILWIILVGLGASIFILLYEPFGIANTTGEWHVDLVIFSLGLVFIASAFFAEFVVPALFPKPFKRWTVGKAMIWYPIVIVFLGGVQFLYKSWWGGWIDFTWQEFFFVLARMLGISFTVAFFILGIWQYLDKKKFSRILSKEVYNLKTPDGRETRLDLSEVLFIASDDNYVDIHIESAGTRKKIILRSSLKNIETQLANPISPIKRCHRGFLINTNYFKILEERNRKMTIGLENYNDEIPVSGQFIPLMKEHLDFRH